MEEGDVDLASGIAAFEAKEFRRSMQLLQPLAERGEPEAQYRIAVQYQAGLGVVQNDLQAYAWMRRAAEQDLDLALHGLGIMYLYGECVDRNPGEAARWLQKAADRGLPGSMAALANMYDQGVGVPRDPERAKELYRAAGLSD